MIELIYVPCGNLAAHEAHPMRFGGVCSGLSDTDASAMSLIRTLERLLLPYSGRLALYDSPEQLELQCHPSVFNAIRAVVMPSFATYMATNDSGPLPVPIKIDPRMAYGGWRLVLAYGAIPAEIREVGPARPDFPS